MTREELKEHCEREIRTCEFWAHGRTEELNNNKIYQEHKLILELLEQQPIPAIPMNVFNKMIEEIMDTGAYEYETCGKTEFLEGINYCLDVIQKYRTESEG